MNMKKMGLALSLTAAFGLMACGDSSSNANGGMPTCNVTSDANSVTMTSSFQGESYIQKVVIDGDFTIKTTTMKGMPQEDVDEECYITKMDKRGADVTCSGNTITVKDDADGVTIEYLKKNAESMCKDITSGGFDDADEEVECRKTMQGILDDKLGTRETSLNLLDREPQEEGVIDYCHEHGIGFISFSPLAQGLLTDRYLNGIPADSRMSRGGSLTDDVLTPELLEHLRQLNAEAQQRGETLAEMALAWILAQKGVTSVLVGASSTAQLEKNMRCIDAQPFLP